MGRGCISRQSTYSVHTLQLRICLLHIKSYVSTLNGNDCVKLEMVRVSLSITAQKITEIVMENSSILLAPKSRHILASLDSVASSADGIQKEAKTKLPPWGFEPRPQPAVWFTRLSGRFHTPAEASVLNPSTKQAHLVCMNNF